MAWRLHALERLESAKDNEEVAVQALNALDRVESARSKSKNLHGAVSHDMRVSAAVARHSVLVLCQRSSRFAVQAETSDTIARLRAEVNQLRDRTRRLREELEQEKMEKTKERDGRVYLLARSRDNTPAHSPERGPRGKKRNIRDRRGEPPAPDPPLDEGEGAGDAPSPRNNNGEPGSGRCGAACARSLPLPYGPVRGCGPPGYGGLAGFGGVPPGPGASDGRP